MKKVLFAAVITALCASCAVTQPAPAPAPSPNVVRVAEYQEFSARNLEPEQTMLVSPVIADLEVSETKVYHVEREVFAESEINESVLNNIAEFKKIALSRAARAYDADVMVGTIMDVVVEDGQLVVTVSGYPAKYKNFRVATIKDTELVREAIIFKNDLGDDVVSRPTK